MPVWHARLPDRIRLQEIANGADLARITQVVKICLHLLAQKILGRRSAAKDAGGSPRTLEVLQELYNLPVETWHRLYSVSKKKGAVLTKNTRCTNKIRRPFIE